MSSQNIDISLEKIFVDISTYKVSLVYIPISEPLYPDVATFEMELRMKIVKILSEIPTLFSERTDKFIIDLSNGILTIDDLYAGMKGIQPAVLKKEEKQISKRLKIVAMNAPKHIEIEVTKDIFLIGKNASAVDGLISFNKMISRVHCRITKEKNQYMLTDFQSTNGTYINGSQLLPMQPYQIKNGDIIRLANSDFQVIIS